MNSILTITKLVGETSMPRPSSKSLTDYELAIVKILWDKSPLSVAEILKKFPRIPKPAYTSLLTIVRAMEKKGYLGHVKVGKAYLYSPKIDKERYKSFEIRKIVDRFFGGSALDLAVNLIKEEALATEDIEHLKKLIRDL